MTATVLAPAAPPVATGATPVPVRRTAPAQQGRTGTPFSYHQFIGEAFDASWTDEVTV